MVNSTRSMIFPVFRKKLCGIWRVQACISLNTQPLLEFMKTIPVLILSTLLLATVTSTNAQDAVPQSRTTRVSPVSPYPPPAETGPRFDIDFNGGTPQQLIDAIKVQAKIHVNAVIPTDCADYIYPALKMKDVTVPELFQALQSSSLRTVRWVTGSYTEPSGQIREQYQMTSETAGFKNVGNVWYFAWQRQPKGDTKPKICRFYQLEPYLKNRKVEDITTAVTTGWKMLGATNLPDLKFHQETQMLIAVGDEDLLKLIDNVLAQLRPDSVKTGPMTVAPSSAPKSPAVP